MKLLDRDSFLEAASQNEKPSTLLCVRFNPLALLAEEISSHDLEAIKREIEYRGAFCFSGSLAHWSDCDLFILVSGASLGRQSITEECQSYADLIQEPYTLPQSHEGRQQNSDGPVPQHHYLRAVMGAALVEGGDITKGMIEAERAVQRATQDTGSVVVWYEREPEAQGGSLAFTRGVIEMLNQGSFSLVYQPQIDLRSGMIHGLEVLLRAPNNPGHPLHGMTPPALIQQVRRLNLLTDLTIQILHRATRAYYSWKAQYPGLSLKISVNVTPDTLLHGYQAILDALPDDLPLDWLVLEITESHFIAPNESPSLAEVASMLRSHGIGISIDDFGRGLSNFDRVIDLACDEIKLDRSLVTRMEHQDVDAAIVNTIVAMTRKRGLRVVGEGIETLTQWGLLEKAGCQVGQGFFFARGKPESAISEYLAQPKKYVRDQIQVGVERASIVVG